METAAQVRDYKRRTPEKTPLYNIILNHLDSFVAARQMEGRPLPDYVVEEFESYLKCGILAHGFLRLKCDGCDEEKVVAFSCKKRGFCPSCAGKRMAEAAAHLVDNVLPLAPYRQFVLTFPIPMRFWLNANQKLFSQIQTLITKGIHRFYEQRAKDLGVKTPKAASITFVQRWGSSVNLNPHLHILALDGVYSQVGNQVKLRTVKAISEKETAELLSQITGKILRKLKKLGYLDSEGELVCNPELDPLFADHDSLAQATASSIKSTIAFGENAGKRVTRIGSGFGYEEEMPLAKGNRCFHLNGFSIHAGRSVNTNSRNKLEE